ncbi:hypothetical protein NKH81_34785 [Mesorhizobium sp. M0959]
MRVVTPFKEVPVAAIHERVAAVNGAADAVAQMIARICQGEIGKSA